MAAVFGIVPGEAPVLNGQPRVPEGGDRPVVALGALHVVALENPGDFPVAPAHQIAGQLIAAAVVVVTDAGDPRQLSVGAVEKEQGDLRLLGEAEESGSGKALRGGVNQQE